MASSDLFSDFFPFVLFVSFVVVLFRWDFIAGVHRACYTDLSLNGIEAPLYLNERSEIG